MPASGRNHRRGGGRNRRGGGPGGGRGNGPPSSIGTKAGTTKSNKQPRQQQPAGPQLPTLKVAVRNITDAGRHGAAADVVTMVTQLIEDVNQSSSAPTSTSSSNTTGTTGTALSAAAAAYASESSSAAAALAAGTIPPVQLWLDPMSARAVRMPDRARDLRRRLQEEAEKEQQEAEAEAEAEAEQQQQQQEQEQQGQEGAASAAAEDADAKTKDAGEEQKKAVDPGSAGDGDAKDTTTEEEGEAKDECNTAAGADEGKAAKKAKTNKLSLSSTVGCTPIEDNTKQADDGNGGSKPPAMEKEPTDRDAISVRIVSVTPPKKTRRRGEVGGTAYLVLTPPMPGWVREKMEGDVAGSDGITAADDNGDSLPSLPPAAASVAITPADRSRAVAQSRLHLRLALEVLSAVAEADAKSSQTYGLSAVVPAPAQRAWKDRDPTRVAVLPDLGVERWKRPLPSVDRRYDSTLERSADYKEFLERERAKKEERSARSKPTPGGLGNDGGGGGGAATSADAALADLSGAFGVDAESGHALSALVVELRKKREAEKEREREKKARKKKAKAEAKKKKAKAEAKVLALAGGGKGGKAAKKGGGRGGKKKKKSKAGGTSGVPTVAPGAVLLKRDGATSRDSGTKSGKSKDGRQRKKKKKKAQG
eukprot:CAMPEP_0181065310 /NCGR_PEP_ID=MMETSP1070-20121207/24672_1 /TAXON_ID=265543 /ORGANISM="Minutocellus polymorphus, Strain NH13" /LENGTH=649 /DNA_ID=CAMNT_0023145695 /DNA_START=142 /DNA_END=2091 /DNA_ORIENTATION=+